MSINIQGKDIELKYTYNSFRYMEDLDLDEMATLESTPFKLIGVLETLLLGAVNHNPKVVVTPNQVAEYMNDNYEDIDIMELMNNLMEKLEESSFFQNLQ